MFSIFHWIKTLSEIDWYFKNTAAVDIKWKLLVSWFKWMLVPWFYFHTFPVNNFYLIKGGLNHFGNYYINIRVSFYLLRHNVSIIWIIPVSVDSAGIKTSKYLNPFFQSTVPFCVSNYPYFNQLSTNMFWYGHILLYGNYMRFRVLSKNRSTVSLLYHLGGGFKKTSNSSKIFTFLADKFEQK